VAQSQDFWFAYDNQDRMTISEGAFQSGVGVVVGSGTAITYNAAGQEIETLQNGLRFDYVYTPDGYLSQVTRAASGGAAQAYAYYTRDLMGRVTDQMEYKPGSTAVNYFRHIDYAHGGGSVIADDTVYTAQSNGQLLEDVTTYANDPDGAVTSRNVTEFQVAGVGGSGSQTAHFVVTNNIEWRDGALDVGTSTQVLSGAVQSGPSGVFREGNQHVLRVGITNGSDSRDIRFVTDINGQVMRRTERNAANSVTSDAFTFYFNGVQVGQVAPTTGQPDRPRHDPRGAITASLPLPLRNR